MHPPSLLGLFAFILLEALRPAQGLNITYSPTRIANQTYDYVIVGGGLAGLVVASRLTEVENVSVLVIEAGDDQRHTPELNDPSEWPGLASSIWSWNATTIPQAVGGRAINLGQGFALGGSTCINGLQWNRGHKSQYDAIESLVSPGWNWDTLLKYMKKAEQFVEPTFDQVERGAIFDIYSHGLDGLLPVSLPMPYDAGTAFSDFVKSAIYATPGLREETDFGRGTNNAAGRNLFSLSPGPPGSTGGNVRSTSASGYIYPFYDLKERLTVLLGHQATGIIWSNSSSEARASGVKFVPTPVAGEAVPPPFFVNLNKEVVVAAGAIGSPHFLELSGIGNKTILSAAGITTKIDLPAVGTNLQDHALTITLYQVNPEVNETVVNSANAPGAGAVVFPNLYQVLGEDRAASVGEQLSSSVEARAKALVESGGFSSQKGAEKILKYQADSMISDKVPVAQITFATIAKDRPLVSALWGLLPQHRGTVHVVSNNPSVRPRIDVGYLLDPVDVEIHIKTLNMSRAIFAEAPLSGYVTAELAPGLSALPINGSDQQFKDWIASNYDSGYHPLGTVPLLPLEDGGAVDPNLFSIRNEEHSSVIPVQLSANPSGTVYGVAEKAADIIKQAM